MFSFKNRVFENYDFQYLDLYSIKGYKEKEVIYLEQRNNLKKTLNVDINKFENEYLFIKDDFDKKIKMQVHSKIGCQPGSELIFLWWEINSLDQDFVLYNKGGLYRKWYGNLNWVLNYGCNGINVIAAKGQLSNKNYYFKPHISWTRVS